MTTHFTFHSKQNLQLGVNLSLQWCTRHHVRRHHPLLRCQGYEYTVFHDSWSHCQWWWNLELKKKIRDVQNDRVQWSRNVAENSFFYPSYCTVLPQIRYEQIQRPVTSVRTRRKQWSMRKECTVILQSQLHANGPIYNKQNTARRLYLQIICMIGLNLLNE